MLRLQDQQVDGGRFPGIVVVAGLLAAIDPVHMQRMNCASQRDVQQAQALLEFLAKVAATVFDEIRRTQIYATLTGIVVKAKYAWRPPAAITDAPDQWQEHD